jgi:hypothetical protein
MGDHSFFIKKPPTKTTTDTGNLSKSVSIKSECNELSDEKIQVTTDKGHWYPEAKGYYRHKKIANLIYNNQCDVYHYRTKDYVYVGTCKIENNSVILTLNRGVTLADIGLKQEVPVILGYQELSDGRKWVDNQAWKQDLPCWKHNPTNGYIIPTFRSLKNGFVDRNACSFCLFYEMMILAKKRHARRNGRKNRCCCKGSPQHERRTVACPVDRSRVERGKGIKSRQSSCSKKRKWGS